MAHLHASQEKLGHLLNRAYLQPVDVAQEKWQDRAHLLAVSVDTGNAGPQSSSETPEARVGICQSPAMPRA
jgi:hypothetical protein